MGGIKWEMGAAKLLDACIYIHFLDACIDEALESFHNLTRFRSFSCDCVPSQWHNAALMDPAIARRGRLRILQPGVQRQWQQRREFFMMQVQIIFKQDIICIFYA